MRKIVALLGFLISLAGYSVFVKASSSELAIASEKTFYSQANHDCTHPFGNLPADIPTKEKESDKEEKDDFDDKELDSLVKFIGALSRLEFPLESHQHGVKSFYCVKASNHPAYYLLFHSWKAFLAV
jgi:hypothetical protein